MISTVGELEKFIRWSLACHGVEQSEIGAESELILDHVSGLSRTRRLTNPEHILSPEQIAHINMILEQRASAVPIQYCLGETWFMGHRFVVRPGVFIPRQDTETLVEAVLEQLADKAAPRIVEVGTGSGAIAVSILKARKDAKIVAAELSPIARETTLENAARLEVADRLELYHGDWLEWLPGLPAEFDAFVSNPPYIPPSDKHELAPEVLNEPHLALFGKNDDGLGFYHDFARMAGRCLKQERFAAMEVGAGQADAVANIFQQSGWQNPIIKLDLSGHKRVVLAFSGNLGAFNAS